MVALLRPRPEPHRPQRGGSSGPALRLIVDNTVDNTVVDNTLEQTVGHPGSRWSAPVFAGGPTLAAAVVVAIVVFGTIGLIRFVQGPIGSEGVAASAGPAAAPPSEVAPAPGDRVVVAEPGDTLWSIAAELAPGEDPRPIVSALIEANGGPSLQIGQQIVIPQQLLD
jgi:LysM repeat protein